MKLLAALLVVAGCQFPAAPKAKECPDGMKVSYYAVDSIPMTKPDGTPSGGYFKVLGQRCVP